MKGDEERVNVVLVVPIEIAETIMMSVGIAKNVAWLQTPDNQSNFRSAQTLLERGIRKARNGGKTKELRKATPLGTHNTDGVARRGSSSHNHSKVTN